MMRSERACRWTRWCVFGLRVFGKIANTAKSLGLCGFSANDDDLGDRVDVHRRSDASRTWISDEQSGCTAACEHELVEMRLQTRTCADSSRPSIVTHFLPLWPSYACCQCVLADFGARLERVLHGAPRSARGTHLGDRLGAAAGRSCTAVRGLHPAASPLALNRSRHFATLVLVVRRRRASALSGAAAHARTTRARNAMARLTRTRFVRRTSSASSLSVITTSA